MAYMKKEDLVVLNRVYEVLKGQYENLDGKGKLTLLDLEELLEKIGNDNSALKEKSKVNMRKYRANRK